MTTTEILSKYTTGEATIEETNAALEEIGSNVRLNPLKNVILPDEITRYCLLNSGWGDLDKAKVRIELEDDMGDAPADCIFMGKRFKVEGKRLVELR